MILEPAPVVCVVNREDPVKLGLWCFQTWGVLRRCRLLWWWSCSILINLSLWPPWPAWTRRSWGRRSCPRRTRQRATRLGYYPVNVRTHERPKLIPGVLRGTFPLKFHRFYSVWRTRHTELEPVEYWLPKIIEFWHFIQSAIGGTSFSLSCVFVTRDETRAFLTASASAWCGLSTLSLQSFAFFLQFGEKMNIKICQHKHQHLILSLNVHSFSSPILLTIVQRSASRSRSRSTSTST